MCCLRVESTGVSLIKLSGRVVEGLYRDGCEAKIMYEMNHNSVKSEQIDIIHIFMDSLFIVPSNVPCE